MKMDKINTSKRLVLFGIDSTSRILRNKCSFSKIAANDRFLILNTYFTCGGT